MILSIYQPLGLPQALLPILVLGTEIALQAPFSLDDETILFFVSLCYKYAAYTVSLISSFLGPSLLVSLKVLLRHLISHVAIFLLVPRLAIRSDICIKNWHKYAVYHLSVGFRTIWRDWGGMQSCL